MRPTMTAADVISELRARGLYELVRDICIARGVTVTQVAGRGRTKAVSRTRQVCWAALRAERGYSTPELGAIWDRDYTTVIQGLRKVAPAAEVAA